MPSKDSQILLVQDAPSWWSDALEHAFLACAHKAYPNEVGIFFYRRSDVTPVALYEFESVATPISFQADGPHLIRFCFDILESGGQVEATGHSHPSGGASFSTQDNQLTRWATHHALAVREGEVWKVLWGKNSPECS